MPNAAKTDLIVVGAGLAGSAAAWAASARGLSVVVLEAFEAGHRRGSSHGSARIFRHAYPVPLYVRMMSRALNRWRQLQDVAGEPLIKFTGELDYGPVRDPEGLHAVLTACGVRASLLSPGEATEQWPGFAFGPGTGPVMHHPEAGVLDPDRAMAAMLRLAGDRGAEVRFGVPAERIALGPGSGATVHTSSGSWTASVVVVTPGPWIAPLLSGLVELPPLKVTQQQVFHFAPVRTPVAGDAPWPTFIYQGAADFFYGLPGGRDGEVPGAIKLGEMTDGAVTTADDRDFTVAPEARAHAIRFTERFLPGLHSTPVNEATCLFTSTASEDFILDRAGPLVISSACSGHGAKFAPLIGEILAGLATGKPSPEPRFTLEAHLTGP